MGLWKTISIALIALRLNALRSFLTMLGIIIGIASVIVMVSVSSGSKAEIERAIELDPLSPLMELNLAMTFHFQGDAKRALAELRKGAELDPNFAGIRLRFGDVYSSQGRFEQAISEYEAMRKVVPDTPYGLGGLGYAYAAAGRQAEARRVLAELQRWLQQGYQVRGGIATVHLGLGEREQALDQLERAAADHEQSVCNLKSGPEWRDLRSEPRFAALLRKMNLEP